MKKLSRAYTVRVSSENTRLPYIVVGPDFMAWHQTKAKAALQAKKLNIAYNAGFDAGLNVMPVNIEMGSIGLNV